MLIFNVWGLWFERGGGGLRRKWRLGYDVSYLLECFIKLTLANSMKCLPVCNRFSTVLSHAPSLKLKIAMFYMSSSTLKCCPLRSVFLSVTTLSGYASRDYDNPCSLLPTLMALYSRTIQFSCFSFRQGQ